MNSSPEHIVQTNFSIYILIGFVLIFVVIAGTFYYAPNILSIDKDWLSNNVSQPMNALFISAKDWLAGRNTVYPNEQDTSSGPAQITNENKPVETSNNFEQHWCLVGEDMTGRWCMQVPTKEGCDAERTFATKNDCEKQSE